MSTLPQSGTPNPAETIPSAIAPAKQENDVEAIEYFKEAHRLIKHQLAKVIVGQDKVIDEMLIAIFTRSHALLVGVPGLAKTLLISTLAQTINLSFKRIQFTPDLMPSDITGTEVIYQNSQTNEREFKFLPGPIFANVILADEINRTPPKTQAALLEAMQERSVTLDGTSHALSPRFMVVATENPIESQGAYPLPEAQLDRFLFKHIMGYPSEAEERRVVALHGVRTATPDPARLGVAQVATREDLDAAAAVAAEVRLADEIVDYVVSLVRATRSSPAFSLGASPRAGAMLAAGARARAVLEGRDYVVPDDVKALAPAALRHRVLLSPGAEIEGRRVESALAAVLEQVEPPR
jgi:MoxR-like ATPase